MPTTLFPGGIALQMRLEILGEKLESLIITLFTICRSSYLQLEDSQGTCREGGQGEAADLVVFVTA